MSRARILALGAALALGACGGSPTEEEDAADWQEVETLIVEPIAFAEWIETTGTVEAPQDATLSAEAAGTVQRLVPEGRTVQRGEVVAQLDPGLAAAGVQQAEAAVRDAQALVTQQDDAFRRQEPLLRDSIVSPLEFEGVRAQRQQARAQLQQALATLREAQERLEQSRIRAPFAGVVEEHLVRIGEQVTAGQEVIRVVGPGRVEVRAGLPERFAGDIRTGTPAIVRFNAPGLGEREVTINFVGATIDPESRTFPIRMQLPDASGGAVKADMIAQVRVTRRVIPDALVLPLESVQRDERGESVLLAEGVATGNGDAAAVIQRREVEVGPRSEQGVVVRLGLRAGEEVVVLGRDDVAAGDTVRVSTRYQGTPAFRRAAARDTASQSAQ